MTAILEDGKLRLSGYVGDYYFEDGFTSSDVVLALAQIDDDEDLAVHINSGGGVASEGAAIHALLSARSGTTNIVVEGIAASAASLIAMAGETVTMSAGSVMMIHDPSGLTFGTSEDHSKTIEGLEALATAYARVYAAKSGKTPEQCREVMKAERWLSPQQAVDEGFADETTEVTADAVAAFDYRIYAHAPKRLTALASKKNWRLDGADKHAAPAAHRPTKEHTMSDKTNGGDKSADIEKEKAAAGKAAVAAYQARRKAVMSMEEAKGCEAQAEALIDTDLSEEAIKTVLAAAPKAPAAGNDDDQQPDPKAYEASRAAGAGVGGKGTLKPTAKAPDLVANMRKLLGKEAV
ncbi:head maturation protease, ClpP-related [Pseudorhizobium pelagicum]|uniref:ATP-dependent Clp protease proteolytic subunit n=1 Tax=Pseudorhizobium pelagicum TaxID=1509405 RepID=A0A922TAR7_9HYPH|nr:head maturation protease, ClpP-related [Pseudorhizobium pelagicum]KEQ05743.1 peptidase S14 [Pseudorhizobium pelagicum]KEQ06423.1 peptidase S14 [Pseudorhizobium pelagicum]